MATNVFPQEKLTDKYWTLFVQTFVMVIIFWLSHTLRLFVFLNKRNVSQLLLGVKTTGARK